MVLALAAATRRWFGNLTGKGSATYTYPASGPNSVRPHAVTNNGVWQYTYDANGNLLRGGNRSYVWNADNQPTRITGPDGVTESYGYNGDGARLKRTRSGVTTVYLGGLWEEDLPYGASRTLITVAGQVVAQRTISNGVHSARYLHSDHLGSVAVATDGATPVRTSRQEFTPWGAVRSGGVGETTLNYTGQHKDGAGLLFYNARYYDPGLGRFVTSCR